MFRRLVAAASLLLMSSTAFAACSVDIDGNDAMQFNVKSIEVPKSCKDLIFNLTHSGKLAKSVMGHNWVRTKTRDMPSVATEGMVAGIENNYVKPTDARVITHTDVIGAGEKTSVAFSVSQLVADGDYSFFCSFPCHWSLMNGTLKLV